MIKIGLIAEYNPLHNGHLYHYNKIKELYNDSIVITILSSEFSQRGELCVFNKFIRTKQALDLGSDLVLSNPIYYSMNSASTFAYSNIYFLSKCNVDKIVVGSESDSIENFNELYELEMSNNFNSYLKKLLDNGYSFKLAYMKSFEHFNITIKSNDLLNYFYYKAIQKINPNIELVTIKRINNDYKDININKSNIQSASSIRKNQENINEYIPNFVYDDYTNYNFRNPNLLLPLVKYSLLLNKSNIRDDTEGLSNRFKNISYNTFDELIDIVKTKRYSESKLNRFIISNLLDIKDIEITYPNMIRVIGFNNKGKELLSNIKDEVNIYTSIKEGINIAFDYEIKSDKILDIIYKEDLLKKDLKGPIIR